jgi:acyl carrier protein
MNIEDEVCAIVARQLGLARVAPQARLIEDLGAESLDVVTIGAALEAVFRRPLSDEALFGAETVGDLARAVSDQA